VDGHPLAWNAIVLAGGRASRLGGIDKTALRYRGRTLLEHALASTAGAAATVVVGPASTSVAAEFVTEADAHGGPAAAVVAGLGALSGRHRPWTALIAADQPRVAEALPAVLAARGVFAASDGVVPRDRSARMQSLLAVYRTTALLDTADRAARRAPVYGMPLRELLEPLTLCAVLLAPLLCADVDTAEDARALGVALPVGEALHAR
jgi:molybdopterin-guanine dinucleotide biosynthesis protein A